MEADIEAMRAKYLNKDFDEKTFDITAAKAIEYATLCERVLALASL